MDPDPAQVRAFVLAAEELHFGRAAERLSISQQALSKRIAALESRLGVRLLDRGGRGVRLTEPGTRFLGPARNALNAGEAAVAAVRPAGRPLRIDVWGHLFAPMRTLGRIAERSELRLELGHGRDLPSVSAALLGHQIDVGFGRVHPPVDEGLTQRLVRLEPVDAVLSADHPLASEPHLRPDRLRGSLLWTPGPLDRLDFLRRFADRFGIERHTSGVNLGLDHFAAQIAADPTCFSLFPPDCPLPDVPGIRSIPLLEPMPLYAWSLVWRRDDPSHLLAPLLAALADQARRNRWLEFDPNRDWLP
ncbi:LysR family transcriptional regulator [Glycomyces arizonensis]|uniref:LysR family transcriptional regulator n=1 Tax=Glycomyces arizonensis TaxID=256035 RepID=UPI00041B57CB|nr:LysR family transcriptional regulator [Glycomyces arizonensis]